MAMSSQEIRGRVRSPRVHIKYEVEKEGAIEMISLPFVLGMLADLSGNTAKAPLKKREFTDISTANFEQTLASIEPSLTLQVENKLEKAKPGDDKSSLSVKLKFKSLEDFTPGRLAENFTPTSKLLEKRKKLHNLLTRLEGQAEADEMLHDIIKLTSGDDDGAQGGSHG